MPTPRPAARRTTTAAVAAVALAYAAAAARDAPTDRPAVLDVDGWAEKIQDYAPGRLPVRELVADPSLWKGPVVPTVFHLSYVLVPSGYAVLGLSAVAFAAAAGLLHAAFVRHGVRPAAATAGVLAWVVFPPHRILFTHYFAEPVIALFSAGVFALLLARPHRPALVGAAAGVLLLARPPFLLVIAAVPVLTAAFRWQPRPARWAAAYTLGLLLTFLPWGVRNRLVVGEFIPFTVEGGQTLFHGSYLPVEEDRWQVLRTDPGVAPLVAAAPADPVTRMHYFADLAKRQILADIPGQLVRCVRKGIKFWMMLEPGSWVPGWKTGLAAAVYLPLGFYAACRYRRLPAVRWAAVWVLGLWAIHAAVFGVIRYNFPVLPMMFVLAASAVWPPAGSPLPVGERG